MLYLAPTFECEETNEYLAEDANGNFPLMTASRGQ